MTATATPKGTILWQSLDAPGLEWCHTCPTPSGGRLEGVGLVDRRWRYRSDDFEADLAVGEDGLVESYAGLWRAVTRA